MQPNPVIHDLPFTSSFWVDVARLVLQREQPERWVILVPSTQHSELLRQALAVELKQNGRRVMRLPQIQTPADWLQSLSGAMARPDTEIVRRVELHAQLHQTAWLSQVLGGQGERDGLWALSRQLLQINDELTWAALARADSSLAIPELETRLRGLIRGRYGELAWKACSPEAELALGIWRASLSADPNEPGIVNQLRRFHRVLQETSAQPVLTVARHTFAPHERTLLEQYAARHTVESIDIDWSKSLSPALQLIWPECLSSPNTDVAIPDLRTRAAQLQSESQPLSKLELHGCASLEDEAMTAVARILEWLDAGHRNIGLIALDRIVARRIRALLDRAQVRVQDDTGWKFSTSSAAGALMRWLQLAAFDKENCETSVLLDWLKSQFTWHDIEYKAALIACMETAWRSSNTLRGWNAMQKALQTSELIADPVAQQAIKRLREVQQQASVPTGKQSLSRFFSWLQRTLLSNGMQVAMAADSVGASLLELLNELAQAVGGQTTRHSYGEWRDFIADALENSTFRDRNIESPVILCSMQSARLRSFDHVVIVGADARNFGVRDTDSLFLTPGLRSELGLHDRQAEQHERLLDLALLLTLPKAVVMTWQARLGAEPNPVAPPLERLSLMHRLAFDDDLHRQFDWPSVQAEIHPLSMPAPNAPELVPTKLSASAYNRFISCPYRYFVQAMLGLKPLDEMSEEAEKRDYGELLHRILQQFHARLGSEAQTLQRTDLIAQLQVVTAAMFEPLVAANGDFIAWRERWLQVLPSYVDWLLDWTAQGWRFDAAEKWHRAELMLDINAQQRPLTLIGRVDRIDRRIDQDGAGTQTVIDYKAKAKDRLKKDLAIPGEDTQLPFYRLLLPAAHDAFYLRVDTGKVEAVRSEQPIDALSEALYQRIVLDFTHLLTGASLPANGTDAACKYCDARGLCRKGHWSEEEQV